MILLRLPRPLRLMSSEGRDGEYLEIEKEKNAHKRSERKYQIYVLWTLCGLIAALVLIDAIWGKNFAKDVLPLIIPVITFMIGREDGQRRE